MLRRSPDGETVIWTLVWARPKWLPDGNYKALIPAVALLAVAIGGASWPTPKPSSHESQAQAAQAANHPSGPISSDESANERIADYTFGLEIFTAALVLVAMIEIYFLSEATKTANRQAILLGSQADILERQQGLARTQFFATHRPKVVIRDLVLGWPTPGNPVSATFVISNAGESNCTIAEYALELCEYRNGVRWPSFIPENGVPNIIGNPVVPGQRIEVQIISGVSRERFQEERADAAIQDPHRLTPYAQELNIVLEGYIAYDDLNGLRRRSSFFRIYGMRADRFGPGDDPEREYAD